jgi:hypothetical protein
VDRLKDVEVIERHVVCRDHVLETEKQLLERMANHEAVYQPEDVFDRVCGRCGAAGVTAYIVLAGTGLKWSE